jgi:hypothetical protein
VVDRVMGPNRGGVIDAVIDAAARGDAQLVFISTHTDVEPAQLLFECGATNPVTLWSGDSISLT